jgi:DNA-directed RNA polymerase specialized sigma24 family protein
MTAEQEFADFARARMPHLYRSAWLLCGDPHRAEDLTQETLAKVYATWGPRLRNPAAYAQTTLVRTYISSRRRRPVSPGAARPPGHRRPPTIR